MKVAGARGITRSRIPVIAMLALAATIGMAGCTGDDGKKGDPGAPGATGPVGPTGPTGPTGPVAGLTKPLESCAVCHDAGSFVSATEVHALTGQVEVSNIAFQAVGADLVVTYHITLDGDPGANFTFLRSDYRYDGVERRDLSTDGTPVTLADNGGGDYTATIAGGAAYGNSRYLIRVADEPNNDFGTRDSAIVIGDFPASPHEDVLASGACANCHGTNSINFHYDYPVKAENCTVCHDAINPYNNNLPVTGDFSYMTVGHSIHNSEVMPDGEFVLDGETFAVSFPTYMTNCSICHTGADNLAEVNVMPVTAENCFSCHGSIDSWDWSVATGNGFTFHETFDETTNCQNCHSDGNSAQELQTVAEMHNGLETERVGIIWNGEDTSVTEGAKFTWGVTGVTDNGTNLIITWEATYDGASVNPCNTVVAAGAPGFGPYGPSPANEGTLSILRSYAQGDDFILGQSTSAPGQATSVNLSQTNTVCAGNVATTTIPVDAGATAGMRGRLAIQGKPTVPVPAGFADSLHAAEWPYTTMYARVPSPTREFIVGSGDEPTETRRAIVDTTQCLQCHVGSLYQHGNNRVDNVDLCVMCHNSASNDQNNRVRMGVDASEAYDGKVGQTYELKSFLHAVHSSGNEEHGTLAIYRTRGIYAWAPEGVTPPNWASTPCEKANPTAGQEYLVYGADPTLDVSCQPHTLYHPTYPRPVNDCYMCHVADFAVIPDQTQAMATTLDAGAEPWNNQIDDVLQGASAAACTSCHQGGAAKGHAYQNGWTPTTFDDGRQTIIDAAE